MSCAVAVTILCGHARSGKSAFLEQLRRHPRQRRTAIVGKELAAHPEELAQVLLHMQRERAVGAADFERVIVECGSDANPARAALGLFIDEEVAGFYALDAILTTVDALHGLNQLAANDTAVEQVVFADRLLLSKTDLVSHAHSEALVERLHQLNPRAPVLAMHDGATDLAAVFDTGAFDLGTMLTLEPRFFSLPAPLPARPSRRPGRISAGPTAARQLPHPVQ